MVKRPRLSHPTYDSTKDGNVFQWILIASEDYRKIKQRERFNLLEKLIEQRQQAR